MEESCRECSGPTMSSHRGVPPRFDKQTCSKTAGREHGAGTLGTVLSSLPDRTAWPVIKQGLHDKP